MPGLCEVIVYNRRSNDDNSCNIQLYKFYSAKEKKVYLLSWSNNQTKFR